MTTPTVQQITDEQLAELEELCMAEYFDSSASLQDDIQSLIARLRAAEKDAERYRWLKENAVDAGMWTDESIDAAMRQG